MHVDYERLAGQLLGRDSGEVCKPVVGVYDVKLALMFHSYRTSDLGVAAHLLKKVGAVLAGKLELLAEAH